MTISTFQIFAEINCSTWPRKEDGGLLSIPLMRRTLITSTLKDVVTGMPIMKLSSHSYPMINVPGQFTTLSTQKNSEVSRLLKTSSYLFSTILTVAQMPNKEGILFSSKSTSKKRSPIKLESTRILPKSRQDPLMIWSTKKL